MIAGVLWPNSTQDKAQASLRSALWRLRRVNGRIVCSTHDCLALADDVTSDVGTLLDVSHRLDEGLDPEGGCQLTPSWFSCELLPEWCDDWVLFERERFRLTALHTLEALSGWHLSRSEFSASTKAALAAIRLEPLRETSQRALARSHLAQGNVSEAVRQYRSYQTVLHRELGINPSGQMTDLLRSAGVQVHLEGGPASDAGVTGR